MVSFAVASRQNITKITSIIGSDEIPLDPIRSQPPMAQPICLLSIEQIGSALFGASLLKCVLFEMYNYLVNFRPVLLGAPSQLGALSARLVRSWVNPALAVHGLIVMYRASI